MSDLSDVLKDLMPKSEVWLVKFKGKEFLFIGNPDDDGAIATKEQYENFEQSTAHLFADNVIRSFGREIGTRNDLEFIENVTDKEVSP